MDDQDPQLLVTNAIAASKDGDSAQAIALLKLASTNPDANGIPWLLLAAEHASLGQMQEAEAAYAEAVLRSPDLTVARFQLGLLQVSSGRASMGTLTWKPLLNRPDDDALRRYVEGYIALINDHFDQAIELFTQGLSLPQDNESLMNDVRNTIAAIKQRGLTEPDATSDTSEPEESQHILLSNYAAGATRH